MEKMNPKTGLYHLVKILNTALTGGMLLCCLFFGYITYCNFIGMPAPKLGPISLYVVISDSMAPTFRTSDAIFVAETRPEALRVGDVIAFYAFEENVTITHRIIEREQTAEGWSFRTQGDNNSVADSFPTPESKVIGKYLFQIPRLNHVINRIQQQPWLILFPVLLVVLVQGVLGNLEKAWRPDGKTKSLCVTVQETNIGEGAEPDEKQAEQQRNAMV